MTPLTLAAPRLTAQGKPPGAARAPILHRLGSGPAPAAEFVALVPGADAPLFPIDLPAGLSGPARVRVARRQIEETIGPAVALTLRPMPAPGRGLQFRHVLAAPQEFCRDWIATLADDLARASGRHGRCRAILPDYLALPAAEGIWTLACAPDRIVARLGPGDGFAAEPALARLLLRRALADQGAPRALFSPEGGADAFLAALPDNMRALRDLPRFSGAEALRAAGLPVPVPFGHGELALDLSQDTEAEIARLRRTLRPWILGGVLALAGIGLWSAGMVIETRALRAAALDLRREAETIARDHLLPTGPILDLRLQVLRRIEALQAATETARAAPDPLDLLRRAAQVITPSDGVLNRAAFTPAGGLLVDLALPDFAALDRLVTALRAADVPTRVAQSAAGEGAAVSATLQLGARNGGGR